LNALARLKNDPGFLLTLRQKPLATI